MTYSAYTRRTKSGIILVNSGAIYHISYPEEGFVCSVRKAVRYKVLIQ